MVATWWPRGGHYERAWELMLSIVSQAAATVGTMLAVGTIVFLFLTSVQQDVLRTCARRRLSTGRRAGSSVARGASRGASAD